MKGELVGRKGRVEMKVDKCREIQDKVGRNIHDKELQSQVTLKKTLKSYLNHIISEALNNPRTSITV